MKRAAALVTGASRGIGAAVARRLAAAGHPVYVNYRFRADRAEHLCTEIEGAGGQAWPVQFDVTDAQAVATALDRLLADGQPPIGVLVNNAGVVNDAPLPAIEPDDWARVTRTTLDGFYNVTRPLVMPMVRQRWGRIVNMASVSGVIGNRGQTHYAAAKAGLIGATRSLAQELAKRRITVNAVAPGLIETDMTKDAHVDEVLAQVPMRRMGTPDEVAALVGFLVSDDAAYITGQTITISGGLG